MTRVLIADDDVAIAEALSLALEDEGIDTSVYDGIDLLRTVKALQPDLIVMDVWLQNNQNGVMLSVQLKSNPATQHIPIILISANQDLAHLQTKAKANDSLSKPFNVDLLLRKLQYLLGI